MFQMNALFHHSKNKKKSYGGNFRTSEVHDAITLHPIKYPRRMYKLYVYLLGMKAQELIKTSTKLQYHIQETTKLLFCASKPNIDQSNASLSMNPPFLLNKSLMMTHNISFGLKKNAMLSSTPEKLSSFNFIMKNFNS